MTCFFTKLYISIEEEEEDGMPSSHDDKKKGEKLRQEEVMEMPSRDDKEKVGELKQEGDDTNDSDEEEEKGEGEDSSDEDETEEETVVNHENKPYEGPPMWLLVSELNTRKLAGWIQLKRNWCQVRELITVFLNLGRGKSYLASVPRIQSMDDYLIPRQGRRLKFLSPLVLAEGKACDEEGKSDLLVEDADKGTSTKLSRSAEDKTGGSRRARIGEVDIVKDGVAFVIASDVVDCFDRYSGRGGSVVMDE
ncbi:hypothetical protein M9H77_04886 [Catharanthus roseus]|uniref:Uncharacterized protein n=1 Tax=Catharanthus roseus TaxID=4058 RepID=A0ACC0CFR5_CATRO|nr:hypothetical protein M9H77_04886 [Catharanthus roseus]